MNTTVNPWRKPGAEQLRTLLGGDPRSDDIVTAVVEQLDMDTLAGLAGLTTNAVRQTLQRGAHIGREECLHAIQGIIAEVEGGVPREGGR